MKKATSTKILRVSFENGKMMMMKKIHLKSKKKKNPLVVYDEREKVSEKLGGNNKVKKQFRHVNS